MDSKAVRLIHKMNTIASGKSKLPLLALCLPHWALGLYPLRQISGLDQREGVYEDFCRIFQPIYDNHVKSFDQDSLRDFVDCCLFQTKTCRDPGSNFHEEKGELSLYSLVMDLFAAAALTTADALDWAILHMAHREDLPTKVQAELDGFFGRGTMPCYVDRVGCRKDLPFTNAVLSESLRYASQSFQVNALFVSHIFLS